MSVKVYSNEDVEEIVAAIPQNHRHIRVLIRFRDQEIVLQEATVAAITRAYLSILLHPTRRGVVLRKIELNASIRKPGYAEHQLMEVSDSEEEAVEIITRIIEDRYK